MAVMDFSLGPILLGTVFNVWLYGITVTQTTLYFVSFPRDHKWLKVMVAWLFALDTLNTIFDVGLVWRYTITLFGDLNGVAVSHWLFNIEPVMTVMISSTTQCFFAWRIAKLTGQPWLGWIIALCAFIQFAAGTGATIGCFVVRDFNRFKEFQGAVIVWLGLSALTDILITCILSWYLHSHRTGFSTTDDIITRLVRLTVQTGLITTVWAIADLLIFLILPNNLHLLFQLPLCKLYTNALMSTLNSRAGWGGSFTSDNNADPSSKSAGPTGVAVWHPDHAKSTAIQVVTTATIHRDNGMELEEYNLENTKRIPSEDVKAPADPESRTATAIRLPYTTWGKATSDATSMHSKLSLDVK